MKIVIETNGTDVYVNGVKHSYAKHYHLSVPEKILVSVANEVGFEPANTLMFDDVDWDDFGPEEVEIE